MDAAPIEREALGLTMAERADRLIRTLELRDSERMERWWRDLERTRASDGIAPLTLSPKPS